MVMREVVGVSEEVQASFGKFSGSLRGFHGSLRSDAVGFLRWIPLRGTRVQ